MYVERKRSQHKHVADEFCREPPYVFQFSFFGPLNLEWRPAVSVFHECFLICLSNESHIMVSYVDRDACCDKFELCISVIYNFLVKHHTSVVYSRVKHTEVCESFIYHGNGIENIRSPRSLLIFHKSAIKEDNKSCQTLMFKLLVDHLHIQLLTFQSFAAAWVFWFPPFVNL